MISSIHEVSMEALYHAMQHAELFQVYKQI